MQLQPHEDRVTSLVTRIVACYVQLTQLPTLRPSTKVNSIFNDLVRLCCDTFDEVIAEKVLTHPNIVDIVTPLRCLCSIGEYQLEAHWTERILECGSPKEGMASCRLLIDVPAKKYSDRCSAGIMFLKFPYYDNYLDLVRMELNALASATRSGRAKRFAVLGSGPLPMTALCIILESMKQNGNAVVVHNVDRDPWAIAKSSAMCRKLGYRLDQVSFQCAEVEDQTLDLQDFDVVCLASLVGTTSEQKQSVVAQVARKMGPDRRHLTKLRILNSMMHSHLALPALLLLPLVYGQNAPSSSKRGLVYVPNAEHMSDDSIWISESSDLTWYYNYESKPSPAFSNSKLQFVPMLWGASTTFLADVTSQIENGANITYVLAMNEPDGGGTTGGSAIPAETAAETWQREIEPLKKMGVKLGAPAVTGAPSGKVWLQNFFNACNGKCNADFIPVHWYGNFEGLASHVGEVRAAYQNLTMWVTEYANNNVDLEESQVFYNQSSQFFDRIDYLTHYSYFGSFRSSVSNVGPNAAMLTEKGKLTDLGSWYLGGAATGNIPHGAAGRNTFFAGSAITVFFASIWSLI
ncbi:MAG: hypothetical protein Q9215_001205 [Flavoplaca cf. flavocitrina]